MNKAFEKIINRFKQLQGCDSLANMFISDVIKVIKSIEKEYNNSWIPCSKELPEEGKDVLVTTIYDSVHVAYRMGNKYYIDADEIEDVEAWQPLPEPYEEETEDE